MQQGIQQANLLAKALRISHLCIYELMSAITKNAALKKSPVFCGLFNSYCHNRIEQTNVQKDRTRLHYLDKQCRSDSQDVLSMMKEVLNWARLSRVEIGSTNQDEKLIRQLE